ncbi:uncharacterized protein TERG_11516 [Trichophyton rubrum CBS 118892]|uniref:Uncharacterized protein n=1 Tax=Trichophyton rubrum (strain ATCC MYA-4607 / CBS 118892) TaxID=559305 RepID=A0A087PFG5_TRIRC|nr:uncharacterized protein TERG_11516 [Trichophyton rubrum CBS 118892]KFL60118.1 hypothetical protein TERG_11516 [Trichophyton rubrum CBS 118892]
MISGRGRYLEVDKRDDELSLDLFYLDVKGPEDGEGDCLHTEASSWTIRFMHERANHPREGGGVGRTPKRSLYYPIGNWSRMSIGLFEQPEGGKREQPEREGRKVFCGTRKEGKSNEPRHE